MSNGRTEAAASKPYETAEGSPTLTFVSKGESLAIPYHFLLSLRLAKGSASIVLLYDELKVTIEGTDLHALWRELQLFNVREIRSTKGTAALTLATKTARCSISAIRIERRQDEEDEEDVEDS